MPETEVANPFASGLLLRQPSSTRSAICACHVEHAGSEYGCVTASIGAVSREPQMDDDLTTVIKAADEALYNAKATGRNKVSTAEA